MLYGVENEVLVLCWVVKSLHYSLHVTFFAAKPHQLCVVSPFLRYNPNQSSENIIYTSEMTFSDGYSLFFVCFVFLLRKSVLMMI